MERMTRFRARILLLLFLVGLGFYALKLYDFPVTRGIFIHDFPFYAVSIAIYKNGKPFAGAVFAPAMNEFFLAESGKGAFLNGRAIHVSGCAKLGESLLGTGFVCVRAGIKPDNFDYLPAIAYATQGFRRCGAASLGLCYVAAGRFEAYWELLLNI